MIGELQLASDNSFYSTLFGQLAGSLCTRGTLNKSDAQDGRPAFLYCISMHMSSFMGGRLGCAFLQLEVRFAGPTQGKNSSLKPHAIGLRRSTAMDGRESKTPYPRGFRDPDYLGRLPGATPFAKSHSTEPTA